MPASNKKTEQRVRDVERIAAREDNADTPALMKYLRDASPYVGKIAADALCQRAGYALAEQLIPEYNYFDDDGPNRDPGCYIRTALVQAFAQLGYGPARDVFRRGVRTVQIESAGGVPVDMGAQLRGASALGLAEVRDGEALIEITPLLFDTGLNRVFRGPRLNPELRVVAARAIGRLGNPDGLGALSVILKFPEIEAEADVICECMEAAMELNAERALPLVAPYIVNQYRGLHTSAAVAVINAGIESATELIVSAIVASRGDALKAIALALSAKRTEYTRLLLVGLAESDIESHRLAFIAAIAATADASAASMLEKMSKGDASPKVKAAATKALNGGGG